MRLLSNEQIREICLANGFKLKLQGEVQDEGIYDLNPYVYEAAKAIQQAFCTHPTWLGHAGTGAIFCADCGVPHP
jgi:hypothetical protein